MPISVPRGLPCRLLQMRITAKKVFQQREAVSRKNCVALPPPAVPSDFHSRGRLCHVLKQP